MRNIVNEDGEIIANATDDHTLVGGHHRLAVAASLGQKLFWKDTGEPVKLDPFFKGSSHRHTACAGNVTRPAERPVEARHSRAVPAHPQPTAVMLDFVDPERAGR
jgi:hypothetical protein